MSKNDPNNTRPPDNTESIRRRVAISAGYSGDEETAQKLLSDSAPSVRSAALTSLYRLGKFDQKTILIGLRDLDPAVKIRTLELSVDTSTEGLRLLNDSDPTVVEVACWAAGEQGNGLSPAKQVSVVSQLSKIASKHTDPLCREAAVAALGALEHPGGLDTVIAALEDRLPIRRRAILALAPFSGPKVLKAINHSLNDHDWQVRQAAEDLKAVFLPDITNS